MDEVDNRNEILRDLLRRSTNLALPMGALQALAELKMRLGAVEENAIGAARALGATWADIGRVLGTSRQTLHQRMSKADSIYAPVPVRPRSEAPAEAS